MCPMASIAKELGVSIVTLKKLRIIRRDGKKISVNTNYK